MLRQAVALHQAGRLDEAEATYRGTLAADPGNFDALNLLGVVLYARNRPEEAIGLIEAAIRINPRVADAHGNLGNALRAIGRLDAAADSYRTALRLAPDLAELHFGFALVRLQQEALDDAVAHFQQARRLRPDLPARAIHLCNDLANRDRLDTAEALLRDMVARDPQDARAWVCLAIVKYRQGRYAETWDCYRLVRAVDPHFPGLDYDEARLHLLDGEYRPGWEKFERRFEPDGPTKHPPGFPPALKWRGEDLAGGTLFLHSEQGFGDTIQFCRYVPLAARRARIVLGVQKPLIRLLSSLDGVAEFLDPERPVATFDRFCSLMSLPNVFGTTLETIPDRIPYLAADPQRREHWRRRLAPLGGVRVGLVWSGGARPEQPDFAPIDARRSMSLHQMSALAQIGGVTFVSLQKGPPAAQAANPPPGMVLHDFTPELDDFAETAALMESLDLVISVDTAVTHLAGALGKPVWLLNRVDTCWRWLVDREDSPWYPSLRQFRQRRPGDWAEVLERVAVSLPDFVARVGAHRAAGPVDRQEGGERAE
jgi:Tfp pilus assembly protein PilF